MSLLLTLTARAFSLVAVRWGDPVTETTEALPARDGGSNPKRHHVVPRFYLERFAIKGQVELVERNDPTLSFLVSVEKALAQGHGVGELWGSDFLTRSATTFSRFFTLAWRVFNWSSYVV
jgi:hypothetical protein